MTTMQQRKPLGSGFNLSLFDKQWERNYQPRSPNWEWRFLGPYAIMSKGIFRYHHFALAGVYFGYPLCCIRFFLDGRPFDNEAQRNRSFSLFEGSGFIPCPSCLEKGKELILHVISSQRLCPHPFPKTELEAGLFAPAVIREHKRKIHSQATIKKLKDRIRNHGNSRLCIDDFRVKIADMKEIT